MFGLMFECARTLKCKQKCKGERIMRRKIKKVGHHEIIKEDRVGSFIPQIHKEQQTSEEI